MTDQLQEIERNFEEIEIRLSDPSVYGDPEEVQRLTRRRKELAPVVAAYRALQARREDLSAALELSAEPDFRDSAQAEIDAAKEDIERLDEELKVLLLPRDADDEKNVILELRAGAGGEEAALFAASLTRMYLMYAQAQGWTCEVVNRNDTELGGVKEAELLIEGEGAYSRLKFESGVHRVQRVPETEAQGRIQTSTVTVAVLPEAEDVEVELDPGDLQIDTFRASGAGGQHINKTESAIRVTHLPTGLTAECQDRRSQYKNKERALKILASRLYDLRAREQKGAIAAQRRSQVGSGDRSERIRTYNFPQGRVTDHRIGLTLHKIDAVLDGALDELIDALRAAHQAEKLKGG